MVLRYLNKVCGFIIIASAGIAITAPRFIYPELTETQLFLSFWWLYLVGLVMASVGVLLCNSEMGNE
jgi:hypothetical protein